MRWFNKSNETEQLKSSLHAAQTRLQEQLTREQELVAENARLQGALDEVNAKIKLDRSQEVAIEEEAVPHLCRVGDLAAYLSERTDSSCS